MSTRVTFDSRTRFGDRFTHFGERANHPAYGQEWTFTACGVQTANERPVTLAPEEVTCLRCQASTELAAYRDRLPTVWITTVDPLPPEPGVPHQQHLRLEVWAGADQTSGMQACADLFGNYGETCWRCDPRAADRMLHTSRLVHTALIQLQDDTEGDEETGRAACAVIRERFHHGCVWCDGTMED